MSDKTPASRQLLNITKALLDHANAEIERLRAELQQHNDASWVGLERAKNVRSATIEECARVVECHHEEPYLTTRGIAAAIRGLKNKQP